jgi:hypothetical protein
VSWDRKAHKVRLDKLVLLGQEENRVCVVRLETMDKMAKMGVMVVQVSREVPELLVRLVLQGQ